MGFKCAARSDYIIKRSHPPQQNPKQPQATTFNEPAQPRQKKRRTPKMATTRLAWRTARTQLNQLNRTSKRFYSTTEPRPPHLLTLADLSIKEIQSLVSTAINIKKQFKDLGPPNGQNQPVKIEQILQGKTIALIFGKRSTRTRVASESATALLGGHPMFLSPSDIQLGVNESLYDTSKVVSSMVDGIMARVGDHSEVEVSSFSLS
jgi:ornithine carbamoyltransferase